MGYRNLKQPKPQGARSEDRGEGWGKCLEGLKPLSEPVKFYSEPAAGTRTGPGRTATGPVSRWARPMAIAARSSFWRRANV